MSTMVLISLAVMALALCLTFIRLFRGPSLPDRVVAWSCFPRFSSASSGGSHCRRCSLLLDVAIVVALMGFMATIGFARFLERGGPRDD